MSKRNKKNTATDLNQEEAIVDGKCVTEADIREQMQVLRSIYGLDAAFAPFSGYAVAKLEDLSSDQLAELYKTHDHLIKRIDRIPLPTNVEMSLSSTSRISPSRIELLDSVETEQRLFGTAYDMALEDAVAHELAERCLRSLKEVSDFKGEIIDIEGVSFEVDDGMVDYVQHYIDYIQGMTEDLLTEAGVASAEWEPENFETTDVVVIDEELFRTIVNLQYGLNVVETDESSQLMLYALSLYQEIAFMNDIGAFRLVIMQPRRNRVGECDIM